MGSFLRQAQLALGSISAIDAEGTESTPDLMRHLVYANVQTMDHQYHTAINNVLAGDSTPRQAIELVENADSPAFLETNTFVEPHHRRDPQLLMRRNFG